MTYSRTTHRKSLKNNIYNTRTHKLKHIKNGNRQHYHNPEVFNSIFLNNCNIIKTPKLKVFRIREDGTILSF